MISVTYLSVHGLPWRNTPGSCSFSGDPQETNHGYQCRTATGPTGRGHSPGHNCQLRFSHIIWNLMKLLNYTVFEIWWNYLSDEIWWKYLKFDEIVWNFMKRHKVELFEISADHYFMACCSSGKQNGTCGVPDSCLYHVGPMSPSVIRILGSE